MGIHQKFALAGIVSLALLALGACGKDGSAPPPESTVEGSLETKTPLLPPDGVWLFGDFHSHSTYSADAEKQGGDDVKTIVQLAEKQDFGFLVISDHRTLEQTQDPDFKSDSLALLRGEEWGTSGHAGAFGIQTEVPLIDASQPVNTHDAQVLQAIQNCLAQGGAWVINHPTRNNNSWIWSTTGASGVEIWNSFWALHSKEVTPSYIQGKIDAGFDVNPALVNAADVKGFGCNRQALVFWESLLNQGQRLAAIGGGDRHMLVLPGRPTTHVFASRLSTAGVVEAVRLGRTYVTYRPEGPTVRFEADKDGDGIYETIVGGEVPTGMVSFRLSIAQTIGGKFNVVRNGAVIKTFSVDAAGSTVDWMEECAAGDWYRIDYYEPADLPDSAAENWKKFILTRPLEEFEFYLEIYYLVMSFAGMEFDFTWGTKLPTLLQREDFLRLSNLSFENDDWCRAAITSPIYVKP